MTGLKSLHLSRLYKAKLLDYLYPEVIHHQQQAYQATTLGREWLQQQGIDLES